METKQLGNSDLYITPIGLGTWAMGGSGWRASWGPQDDDDSIRTIRHAVEHGINWIDTAAVYGLGHSEEVVGKALKGLSSKPYLFTKCSRLEDEDGNLYSKLKADSIRQEIEGSLRRLQVDVIDLYQIHWPMPDADIEEGWQTLAELQAEGKVRHIGVSNFNVEHMQRAQAIAPITSLQPPYSLLRRDVEESILPFCLQHNIGVIVYSPMQAGLLSGAMSHERMANLAADDWRNRNPMFQEPQLTRNLKIAGLLTEIGQEMGNSTAEIAIAWTLANPAVTGAIVGGRQPEQVDGFIGAGDVRLSETILQRIEAFVQQA